jgi:hypothetical protein
MATTVFRTIARATLGIAVAGMVLGQAGTAFADEGTPAPKASGSWDTAVAVMTDSQGAKTTVKALSFHYCSNVVGDSITLSERQTVLFEKMARIDVVRSDPKLTDNGTADLAVTLLDGQQLTGTVSANCDFSGDAAPGRFNVYPDALESVEFRRGADAGPTTPEGTGATTQPLRLSGSVAGTFVASDVSCEVLAGTAMSWTATGTADGTPVVITFNTNNYRGPGVYATTGVTDEAGGLATLATEEAQVSSNGATAGTFTVADDRRSGSIDTELTDSANGLRVHVTGSWRCSS